MKDNLELLHDRYARALFMHAEEKGIVDKVMEELEAFSIEWLEDTEFRRLLTYPLIAPYEKKEVIEKLAQKKKCSQAILNFLKVLIDNRRQDLIHAVFLRYKDIYTQFKKRVSIYIETPRALTKKEKALFSDVLKPKFRKEEIDLEIKKNPRVLGGIFMKYKDRVYDYSIRGQLNNLKNSLSQ